MTAAATAGILLIFTPTGFIGAAMKILATLPMILLFGLLASRKKLSFANLALAGFASAVLRGFLMAAVNYYFAIPLFLGISPETAMAQFPLVWIIVPNVILSAIEFSTCAFLFFKTPVAETLR